MTNELSGRERHIFDCHCHCGPVHKFRVMDDGSAESMIDVMDRCGIDRVAFSSMLSLTWDVGAGNRVMQDIVERYPGRMYGYVVIHPADATKSQLDELDRSRGKPGIVGVKIHPGMHQARPVASGYEETYRWCLETGYPVLSHTWGDADIEDFRTITDRYRDLKVILGHSGGPSRSALERACDLVSSRSSVYLDITCSREAPGLVEWMLERAPENRILFGSDMPFIDPRPTIGLVEYADVSESVREAVFRTNAEALFSPFL